MSYPFRERYIRPYHDLDEPEADRVVDALLRVNIRLARAQSRHWGLGISGELTREMDDCSSAAKNIGSSWDCPHIGMEIAHLAAIRSYLTGGRYIPRPRPSARREGLPGRPKVPA